ncbi:ADP-ribosylglycohydrolase [Bradyrhizobium sp. S3.3.6]|uniref:ADP-ribosylglycohydrolase family protein n=1 Tax=Bradyrhizobium sp. S3.3.6 TaxID=3156429 RepID=UPI0033934D52
MIVIPHDYAERVYAGVIGKLIGVYLGRPFEGWTYERIMQQLGPINYYVNERRDVALLSHQLVVTDDDLAGTFAFPRALADNGFPQRLTSEQVGQAWLNYIVEERSTLWWGGIGNSTEHTAYLRLKSGIPAPKSGSIELNGRTVAEQIGAQIFIDGWAMVSPGDPEQAAFLAEQAARVSHDGEAVHAAKLLAAMEAQAFVETDVQKLIDVGLDVLPGDALIRRVVEDVRSWHAADTHRDWQRTRALIAQRYGYDKFTGGCHIVPNHALIILATLYGEHSFQEAMRIANTAGWDTDCNAGNVGCLFGIRTGLAGLDAGPDLRTPIADRIYISSADGGAAITDAVIETRALVSAGYVLAGVKPPPASKSGARFSFEFPGSLQGFQCETGSAALVHPVELRNVSGHSREGTRCLAIEFSRLARGRVARVGSATFFGKDVFAMRTYELMASPTLYSGQAIECGVSADSNNTAAIALRLFISAFNQSDELMRIYGETIELAPSDGRVMQWKVPDTGGYPIYNVGLELEATNSTGVDGALYLDYVRWEGAPDLTLRRPDDDSVMWKHAWVNDASHFQIRWEDGLRISNKSGLGAIFQGSRDWKDYSVEADIKPLIGDQWGLAARVQGRERYYALMFDKGGKIRLARRCHIMEEIASVPFVWNLDQTYICRLEATGSTLRGYVDDRLVLQAEDADQRFSGGGIGLLINTGSIVNREVRIRPL